ncbi:MAG: error-prone DNA polymerase [Rhodospirillales bacterium]
MTPAPDDGPRYAELQATSNYSFLRGASHPEELVLRAAQLGLDAIAITDRHGVSGLVRAHIAAREAGIRLVIGARLDPEDGPGLLCFPTDRAAYGRLCRLLTLGKRRAPKGECHLRLDDILAGDFAPGQIVVALMLESDKAVRDEAFAGALIELRKNFKKNIYLAVSKLYNGNDDERVAALAALSRRCRVGLVATNDVHAHVPERRPLQDVLTCIREGCTIADAGYRLFANAERHLKGAREMARLFADYPEAIRNTTKIARACTFRLDELRYEYPADPVPGGPPPGAPPNKMAGDAPATPGEPPEGAPPNKMAGDAPATPGGTPEGAPRIKWRGTPPATITGGLTPQRHLERLTREGAEKRYPDGIPEKVARQIEHELALIAELGFAPYFLTVDDIIRFAESRNILCQGRGSAANSAVCYCLGITAVDPARIDVLFERFVSAERGEPPDIDVDFENARREEVIQYIYGKYGRERAAMTATVITYRSKSAIREVGKALGVTEDTIVALQGAAWRRPWEEIEAGHIRETGLDPGEPTIRRVMALAGELRGFPRHLSQHTGGMVMTRGPLSEVVPIANAAMEDRTVIEWDKDDLDALGILKVDVLGLGMLTCVHKAFDLIARHHGRAVTFATVPAEDAQVYDMLCRADSVGVFQVESRAQMSMLPRLRPRSFYDLVIEVAIVRPGPIQGDMVHPYLRRRRGEEPVAYPSPELERVLGKTLGIPLFQEQAMKIAIVAAGFTPTEADALRRALATFRRFGDIHRFRERFVRGMRENGYTDDFAERCFRQIEGFADYGFPESHAASFALIVYVSAWIKCHYPAAFACALLNSQPMGFYAPAQIVRDAREHGVEVHPVDVNESDWDCTLEDADMKGAALRLGFRQVKGLAEADADTLVVARGDGYPDAADLQRRSGLGRAVLEKLARADAFGSLGLDRRQALWAVRGLDDEAPPPLLAAVGAAGPEPAVALPATAPGEAVADDYRALRLSLKAHPLSILRPGLEGRGIVPCARLRDLPHGQPVRVAGLVITRQRPGSAKGVVFVTLEDETGIANLVVWASVFERFRRAVIGASLLAVEGEMQREGEVIHVVADKLQDMTPLLARLDAGPGALLSVAVRDFH